MTTAMSEQNTHREAAVQQQQAAAQSRNLNAELQVLAKFGGFNVLESSVDGIQNLNPERKARRNIFLTDPERASERKELEKRLEMWVDMLQGNKSISEMIELCQKKSAAVSDLLSQNQRWFLAFLSSSLHLRQELVCGCSCTCYPKDTGIHLNRQLPRK